MNGRSHEHDIAPTAAEGDASPRPHGEGPGLHGKAPPDAVNETGPDGTSDVSGSPEKPLPTRPSTVAKVSHTLSLDLAEKLEQFAFFQRVSESAVIEHSLIAFFAQTTDDTALGAQLRSGGAGRRRKR